MNISKRLSQRKNNRLPMKGKVKKGFRTLLYGCDCNCTRCMLPYGNGVCSRRKRRQCTYSN